MTIQEATRRFESWLGKQAPLDRSHLALKHKLMSKGAFPFLRATFYRWIQLLPAVCPELIAAPKVLAVGDLHIENFGTWRDHEGRLVWGINDFDEAFPLPYTQDLVRLATSAVLGFSSDVLRIKPKEASAAILSGYAEGIKTAGQPFVLAERHKWLAAIALARLENPARFWRKLEDFPEVRGQIPATVRKALENLMPEAGLSYKTVRRVSGLGSLGRQRFAAIADWLGGKIAREAKALTPSACVWAQNGDAASPVYYQTILDRAVRCRDPYFRLDGSWIVRRLSPNCSRIELETLPSDRDDYRILYSMGWETANIHVGDRRRLEPIQRDLMQRPAEWLRKAAKAMARAVLRDWKEWKRA
jgi:uncharacterized protein (DUF2252 family)